jgi:hypothetical protein
MSERLAGKSFFSLLRPEKEERKIFLLSTYIQRVFFYFTFDIMYNSSNFTFIHEFRSVDQTVDFSWLKKFVKVQEYLELPRPVVRILEYQNL